jgi:hypothetical protein
MEHPQMRDIVTEEGDLGLKQVGRIRVKLGMGIVRNGSELRGGLPLFRLKKRDPLPFRTKAL